MGEATLSGAGIKIGLPFFNECFAFDDNDDFLTAMGLDDDLLGLLLPILSLFFSSKARGTNNDDLDAIIGIQQTKIK